MRQSEDCRTKEISFIQYINQNRDCQFFVKDAHLFKTLTDMAVTCTKEQILKDFLFPT